MMKSLRHIFLMMTALLLMSSAAAFAQDIKKQKARISQIERDISIMDKQIAGIKDKRASALDQLDMLRSIIRNRRELVSESDRLIKSYSDSIRLKDNEIKVLQAEVDTLIGRYGKLVKSAYKHRDSHVWYLYILASDNLGQAFRRAGYFRNISKQIKEDAAVIRTKQSELEQQRSVLDGLKLEAQDTRKTRVRELENLRKDEKEVEMIVQQMMKDRKALEKQIAEKKKQMETLNRDLQRAIAEANRPKGKSKENAARIADNNALSAQFESNKGLLPWPVKGTLIAGFGKRYLPGHSTIQLPESSGIDIAVESGEEVKCIFDGTVLNVGIYPLKGPCVAVMHGSKYLTYYIGLSTVLVKKDDKVKAGQTLGVVNEVNGMSKMHFIIWEDTRPQDPLKWLRKE